MNRFDAWVYLKESNEKSRCFDRKNFLKGSLPPVSLQNQNEIPTLKVEECNILNKERVLYLSYLGLNKSKTSFQQRECNMPLIKKLAEMNYGKNYSSHGFSSTISKPQPNRTSMELLQTNPQNQNTDPKP
ncbi:hypothetical protein BB560_005587 [Smittium megazygosporum]|uniref:Uncharacterized protein n=1 Tax=Smittium megazygosporum TaxID=133381 RepID=A0A2T9Z2T2_9FUNG|nr:hypothetical protein BB560_005587 [Smittium megazygosporum]